MYKMLDVAKYNGKNVLVKTAYGKERTGLCHVYSELNDDNELDDYISINGGMCIDVTDIASIEEI